MRNHWLSFSFPVVLALPHAERSMTLDTDPVEVQVERELLQKESDDTRKSVDTYLAHLPTLKAYPIRRNESH